jgi:RNA polymerase sigma-70 factor, ECF subfamily
MPPAVNPLSRYSSLMVGMIGVMVRPREAAAEAVAHPRDFDAWLQAEQRRVFLLCFRLLGDRDEADTVTQEVFLKAHRALVSPGSAEVADPARWLTRVAVNACLDRLRSRRWRFWRQRPAPDDEQAILALARERGPSAEDRVFATEITKRLAAALVGLSARQRSIFILKHYEDRSLEEIADILGLDVGTVKSHMARALVKLRTELRDLYLSTAHTAG